MVQFAHYLKVNAVLVGNATFYKAEFISFSVNHLQSLTWRLFYKILEYLYLAFKGNRLMGF